MPKDLTSSQTGNDAMSSTYRAGFHTNVATGMSPKGQATSPRHQRRPAMALNAGLQDFPARHQGFVGKSLLPKTQQLHMVSQQKSTKILENLGFLIWFALKRSDGMESICVSFLGVILGGPFVTYFSRATSHLSCHFKLNGFATDWDLRR